jgi:hypothetical protein
MIDFATFKTTKEEVQTITQIAKRAIAQGFDRDLLSITMDLEAAHHVCPLDLDALRHAPQLDMLHDVAGIARHLNHDTGQPADCFVPRFAKR